MPELPLTIGVLALQGAFEAHAAMLRSLGAHVLLVRKPEQLAHIDAIVLPGGESTTMLKLLGNTEGFFEELQAFTKAKPAFGTCAGAILLATRVTHPQQASLAAMDIAVERNSYGRQIDSRILPSETTLPGGPFEMVYIRAPRITETGPHVEVLAQRENTPTLVREGHLLAATFHPELANDPRVHQLFLDMVRAQRARSPDAS